jgi:hypothetical protein
VLQEGGGAAGAVPADVAASMRQFIQALTTPETEMEQQAREGQRLGQAQGRHNGCSLLGPSSSGSVPGHCIPYHRGGALFC